jgi:hypothetical protein
MRLMRPQRGLERSAGLSLKLDEGWDDASLLTALLHSQLHI